MTKIYSRPGRIKYTWSQKLPIKLSGHLEDLILEFQSETCKHAHNDWRKCPHSKTT